MISFVLAIIVFLGSSSILQCYWKVEKSDPDFLILLTVMYLYDADACGYPHKQYSISELVLSNDTLGLPVYPIKRKKADITVSAKLSSKTRT